MGRPDEPIPSHNSVFGKAPSIWFITVGATVLAGLHFYNPPNDDADPEFRVTSSNGTGTKNYGHQKEQVMISDIRGMEGRFNIDEHSFAAFRSPNLNSVDLRNDDTIIRDYYPAVEEFILEHILRVESVFIFDHCVRKALSDKSQPSPVRKVHIDQSPQAAFMRLERHVPKLVGGEILSDHQRFRILNIWRPIHGHVQDHLLEFADSRSVEDEDLVKIAHIYHDRVGETLGVKFNPRQRFWYWSDMGTNEVLVLQCFDSGKRPVDQPPSRCAHASFDLPGSITSQRKSIERGAKPKWEEYWETYGNDHPKVLEFINSYPSDNLDNAVLAEIISITGDAERRTFKTIFRDVGKLKDFLASIPQEPHVRTITVRSLTRSLIRLLGARFEMDYELWTARFQSSDREYFAGPLNEQGDGPSATPQPFLRNRRISHTVRSMRLIDTNPLGSSDSQTGPRMYLIRRVSGHLRKDGPVWTFLFFCDQIPTFEESNYVSDIPGQSMPCIPDWIAGSLNVRTPDGHYERLLDDGFGLVSDNFNDEDFITATSFLGRRFLLNLDYFQRQLLYQQRYINFLTSMPAYKENSIVPRAFLEDLKQEGNALLVVDSRLKALRDRTTTILNTVISLNSIRQARIAGDMAQLQREDAAMSFRQGESLRRLTLLNMVFLPPSLVASIYGMNTNVTMNTKFWTFIIAALISIMLTGLAILIEAKKTHRRREDIEAGKTRQNPKDAGFFRNIWNWLGTHHLVYNEKRMFDYPPIRTGQIHDHQDLIIASKRVDVQTTTVVEDITRLSVPEQRRRMAT
ncbi:hypothetical protein V500_04163 [Pseudogymnoascus sp. VKM F-4518 (FW-2643)]|nr:hypothetical protein V500_04163 [Pseudogymnoascus sp. VKM F-4518 (FW-2643)]